MCLCVYVDEAQSRFSNAKSISSDQYFNKQDDFGGGSSSGDYGRSSSSGGFGSSGGYASRGGSSGGSGSDKGFMSMASDMISDLQDRYS